MRVSVPGENGPIQMLCGATSPPPCAETQNTRNRLVNVPERKSVVGLTHTHTQGTTGEATCVQTCSSEDRTVKRKRKKMMMMVIMMMKIMKMRRIPLL